jgi:DNA-binding transcriptional ArsR family regulator
MALQQRDDATKKRGRIARTLVKEGDFSDVHVLDRRAGRQVLTEKRLELIDSVRDEDVESVRGLADALDRDKADVSRDLDLLFERGIVTFTERDGRKIPELAHETVIVGPIC